MQQTPHARSITERGGVLALVSVVIIVLLMFVALVVDTHLQLTQREQASYYARLAALAAVESFMDARSENAANSVRYDKALEAVNRNVSQDTSTLSPGGKFSVLSVAQASSDGLRLEPGVWAVPRFCGGGITTACCNREKNTNCQPQFTPVPYAKLNAAAVSDDGVQAPVGGSGDQVNAFRVIGTATGGLTPLSRAMFNARPQGLGVSVVAAAMPRRGVYLVDLSGSSVADSHPNQTSRYAFPVSELLDANSDAGKIWNSMPDWRNGSTDYSQFFKSDYSGISETRTKYETISGTPKPPPGKLNCDHVATKDCAIDAGPQFVVPDEREWSTPWDELPAADLGPGVSTGNGGAIRVLGNDGGGGRVGDAANGAYHYVNPSAPNVDLPLPDPVPALEPYKRYVRAERAFDGSGMSGRPATRSGSYQMRDGNGVSDSLGQLYLIDRVALNGLRGRGPEPLTSIMNGLNGAVQMFSKRRVAGDQVGIVFFDQYVTWNRTYQLSSNFDYLRTVTDTTDPMKRRLSHGMGLFPGVTGYTDLPSAFQEALSELVDPKVGVSTSRYLTSDFIAMIGDGLTNCQPCRDGSDMEGQNCTNPALTARCLDSFDYYQQSKKHFGAIFNEPKFGLVANNIQFHVFLVGASVMPHTRDIRSFRKDDPTKAISVKSPCDQYQVGYDGNTTTAGFECQTESEFRDWYARTSEDTHRTWGVWNPFHFVEGYHNEWSGGYNDNYNFDGKSAHKPFYQANADYYVFSTAGNGLWAPIRPRDEAECQNYKNTLTDPNSGSLRNKCMVPPCERWKGGDGYAVKAKLNRLVNGVETPSEIGNIRTSDPYCRTATEQMQDYMKQIFNSNPYAVVQTEEF